MNRIDRLFGILTLLQSRRFTKAELISEKFGISIRTVYRDVKAIAESGIPVSFEASKGYFIIHGYFLPPVSFSSEEANSLLLMEAIALGFADKSIQKHYASALNKVKAVLHSGQKEKVEKLSRTMRIQIPDCFNNGFEYLSPIQNSIISGTKLSLKYKNAKEEVSKRLVEPIGLVFYAMSWHLIAWCHKTREYRDFKVIRIVDLKDTMEPFSISKHMDLNDYMKKLPVDY